MASDGPASPAHCFYCFEVLSAHFEGKEPLELSRVVQLYEEYQAAQGVSQTSNDAHLDTPIDRDHGVSPASSSTTTTTPSSGSEGATPARSASRSPASLTSGLSASYPVYVTWNTLSPRRGGGGGVSKALRGCIGTFEPLPLEQGLRTYSMVSALEDYRFSPIPATLLPSLGCGLTLLSSFENCADVMDWTIGVHGLKINFVSRGRRMGATYLPQVCPEQGWDKEECLESLMCKAGWEPPSARGGGVRKWLPGGRGAAATADDDDDAGPKKPWDTVSDMKVVRYQGAYADADYRQWREWRAWAKGKI